MGVKSKKTRVLRSWAKKGGQPHRHLLRTAFPLDSELNTWHFFVFSQWEAFSLPELQNFLRILDKEEDEQLQNLKRRYTAYRLKLEEALGEVWKPG